MNSQQQITNREILLKIFSQSLRAVNGRQCVSDFLRQHPLPASKVRVIAIGKAAASMMLGVFEHHAQQVEAGLIVTKDGHTADFESSSPPVVQLESAHPYSDQRSVDAGIELLNFIKQTPAETGLLFLISGGASALVEVLPAGANADQLQALNRWLLAKGWSIDVMNRIRKSVSLIKAGRLARYVAGHAVMQLLISDVPGNELSVIGSGLLVPSQQMTGIPESLPDWLTQMQLGVPAAPAPSDACFAGIQSYIIASNEHLRESVAKRAKQQGFPVCCNAMLTGEAAAQGRQIASALIDGPAGVYIWGGETVVTLPEQPGQGGRCQQLALAAAQRLAGQERIALLAVGTDGNDGPGDVAGALIDGQTLNRGHDAGALDASDALQQADAGSFLAASGDLIDTGPTGTNVMDLVLGLKD